MKTRVVLALAAGLFLVSLGPLFAYSICNSHNFCVPHPEGNEFCMSYFDPNPRDGDDSFCIPHGRECNGWIPVGDCDEIMYSQCTMLIYGMNLVQKIATVMVKVKKVS